MNPGGSVSSAVGTHKESIVDVPSHSYVLRGGNVALWIRGDAFRTAWLLTLSSSLKTQSAKTQQQNHHDGSVRWSRELPRQAMNKRRKQSQVDAAAQCQGFERHPSKLRKGTGCLGHCRSTSISTSIHSSYLLGIASVI